MKSPLLTASLIILAAAFAPGAPAQDLQRHDPALGRAIAEQGNRALAQIRAQVRENVKHLSPVPLSDYAALPAALQVANDKGQTLNGRKGQTLLARKGVES